MIDGLYLVITNPVAGHAACAEAAVRAGLGCVQLRMKDAATAELLRVAQNLRTITRGTNTRFVVNDDVAVARAVDADGVHLGQADLAIAEAKRRWPEHEGKLFGLSTHDEAQAAAAVAARPDYIGVGPVYPTPTKRVADPVLGVERAAAIVRASTIPTVAIGGIDCQRLPELVRRGIRSYAVVRYVCQRPRPYDAIRELLDTAAEAGGAWTAATNPSGT